MAASGAIESQFRTLDGRYTPRELCHHQNRSLAYSYGPYEVIWAAIQAGGGRLCLTHAATPSPKQTCAEDDQLCRDGHVAAPEKDDIGTYGSVRKV